MSDYGGGYKADMYGQHFIDTQYFKNGMYYFDKEDYLKAMVKSWTKLKGAWY
jgi:hypothetical protein